tara:strand:+ start:60 stop:245 length:186 start_codon:yes stop_codon:yes gene_type:complete
MAEVELVRYLWNSAGSAIKHAENLSTKEANLNLDEAGKNFSLPVSILYRSVTKKLDMRELV